MTFAVRCAASGWTRRLALTLRRRTLSRSDVGTTEGTRSIISYACAPTIMRDSIMVRYSLWMT